MNTSKTTDYDPRYDRAQTVRGAKARYLSEDLEYDEAMLEADLERLLDSGENPDRYDPKLTEPEMGYF